MRCLQILLFMIFTGFFLSNTLTGKIKNGSSHSILEGLDLTWEQKKQIASLREEYPLKSIRGHLRSFRQRLHRSIRNPNSSEMDLQKIHEELIAKKIVAMRRRFQFMMRLRKILNPQQLEIFHDKMQRIFSKKSHENKHW